MAKNGTVLLIWNGLIPGIYGNHLRDNAQFTFLSKNLQLSELNFCVPCQHYFVCLGEVLFRIASNRLAEAGALTFPSRTISLALMSLP